MLVTPKVENRMISEDGALDRLGQSGGSMYYNVTESSVFPLMALQSQVSPAAPLPGIHGMMAQGFQHYGLLDGGLAPESGSNFGMSWCYGIQSEAAKEWALQLNKNGMIQETKLAAEASVEAGRVMVRSQLCPWSSMHVNNTNRIASIDPMSFHGIIEDAGRWCKYCASLEKELTYSLQMKIQERWDVENSRWEDVSFVPVADQYFESRASTSLAEGASSRKRKYGLDDWENDRSEVLLKMNELNTRATRAKQRVVVLEQLLRNHALVALDETCDSDIVTFTPQHDSFNEGQSSEMLVCKIAGCNKSFKSSKTMRRHALQKHSDNARFLVCNQPTVNGLMCRFETIHSGVLSYHRKHSLAHQRREDWHISCPFCQSKFARQHEMERHRRICKSRPAAAAPARSESANSMLSTITVPELGLNRLIMQTPLGSSFNSPDQNHSYSIFNMPESNVLRTR